MGPYNDVQDAASLEEGEEKEEEVGEKELEELGEVLLQLSRRQEIELKKMEQRQREITTVFEAIVLR